MPSDKRARQRANAEARAAQARAAAKRRANRRRSIIAGGAVLIVVVLIALLIANSTGGGKSASSTTTLAASPTTTAAGSSTTTAGSGPPAAPATPPTPTITGTTPCPKLDGSSPRTIHFAQKPPSCIDPSKKWTATFATTEGNVVVALDTSRTAGTANNFILLSLYHYYDGTSMFRIDTSIDIIQGGSPTTQSANDPGPGYTINDEGGKFTYQPGDLVMARTSGPNSGAAQYFFVVGSKGSLLNSSGTYVVFGHVTQGLDVLQNIEKLYEPYTGAQAQLGGGPSRVVLVKSITITSA